MSFEINWQTVIMDEISNPKLPKREIARTYGYLIRDGRLSNWRTINEAIIARFGQTGLDSIRKSAWKNIQTNIIKEVA